MNFLFFMLDECRAESLACYGHPLVQTPHFDHLAADGTLFANCYVQNTVCTPSRISLFTGWYPHVSGHRSLFHFLRPHQPNMFQYLKRAGYNIAWYGRNDLFAGDTFRGTVDEYYQFGKPGMTWAPFSTPICSPDEPPYWTMLQEPMQKNPIDRATVDCGLEFLRNGPREPFVLYMPLIYPHPPYTCPQPYYDMYSPDDIPELRPRMTRGAPDFHALIRDYRSLAPDDPILTKVNAVYLGMISYTDALCGEMLAALDDAGLTESTMICLFADHGDWAGDYGLVEKWPTGFDDTLARVPCIVKGPGVTAGHRVTAPVELMDLMPTVLDCAGAHADHVHFARSLVSQLDGDAGEADRAVFAEGGYDPFEPHASEGRDEELRALGGKASPYYPKLMQQKEHPESACRSVMARHGQYKFVRRSSGANELYDLAADPRELANVIDKPDHAGVVRDFERRLLDWYLTTSDAVRLDPDPRWVKPNFK